MLSDIVSIKSDQDTGSLLHLAFVSHASLVYNMMITLSKKEMQRFEVSRERNLSCKDSALGAVSFSKVCHSRVWSNLPFSAIDEIWHMQI